VSTCALRCLAGCALASSACTASSDAVRPPPDQLFFPSGLTVDKPDNASVLFVANANSELRYDSGSISVIDLSIVDSVISAWVKDKDTGGCEPDLDHRETLVCDESIFIKKDASVRIGNFATDIALQNFGGPVRVFVPTRGDPSIAWADYDGGKLSCTTGSEGFALCDDAHRLSTVQNDPNLPIVDEPFGVFADPGPVDDHSKGFAIVTHLTSGAVTLIDSPSNGNAQVADVKFNLFLADQNTGLRGATGVAGRTPGEDGDIIYVGSRTEDRIQTLTVGRPFNGTLPYLLPSNYFFLDSVGGNTGGSTDTRDVKFSRTGDRMYVVNRRPPSLQVFDTSLGPSGFPRNAATGASDICRQGSKMTVFGQPDNDPVVQLDNERAYVTCFQEGEVYVVDPRGQSQVEDIITVGRGPYSVAAAKLGSTSSASSFLFVSNFLEDTIAVVDVTPTSATRDRVVLRIGEPRTP
jgi:hypothetical protein